jgi:hypothetical protein
VKIFFALPGTENPSVGSSILPWPTTHKGFRKEARFYLSTFSAND